MDYRHHATDVIAGAIIGLATGWWGYRQYYPALASRKSWKPYAPRIPKDDGIPLHNVSSNSEGAALHGRDTSNTTGTTGSTTYPPTAYGNAHGYNNTNMNTGYRRNNDGPVTNTDYDAQNAPSMPMPGVGGR